MLSDLSPDSDGEILNSSHSLNSSSSSSDGGSTVISLDSPNCNSPSSPSSLTAKDFKLIRRIGSGDIGTVYLCRLREDQRRPTTGAMKMFAMKVVDEEMVRRKKKTERAVTEKRVMKKLNHPFLPTVFADFDASPDYSCLVMEYCSGGDLHSLRHRQPASRFSLEAARFYAAEVLLALEYLHMLGIVYRDLKPENVFIRSDGHVMLSDFDLVLEATSYPTVEQVGPSADRRRSSCFPIGRLFRKREVCIERRFVAEPVDARSHSFVGTHEYVAPEVAYGRAHGSAVDWWAYGVFLYELLYGKTPFVGPTNEATIKNIIKEPLSFPPPSPSGPSDAQARDLIVRLLEKDPSARLGLCRGAADLKVHPFFKGINFALLRSCRPPFVPGPGRPTPSHKPERFDDFF